MRAKELGMQFGTQLRDWGEGVLTMSSEAMKKLEFATCNMSVPVIVALLDSIHTRLQQTDELEDVAERVREALALLYDKRDEVLLSVNERPN